MNIKMDDIIAVTRCNDLFKISWKMTSWCNYRCSYCYMSSELAKNKHTPVEKVIEIASNIDKLIEKQSNNRKVELHLIGGEVGYYDLTKVLDQIKSNIHSVIVATNFSNEKSYWINLKKYCDSRGTQLKIIASLHLEQCDIKEFMRKALELEPKVKCVINPDNINSYKIYLDELVNNDIDIEISIERNNKNECIKSWSQEDEDYIKVLRDYMSKKHNTYFKVFLKTGEVIRFSSNIEFINSIDIGGFNGDDFVCTAGLDGLRIAPDGSVRRAGCRHASVSQNRLGYITDKDIVDKLPNKMWSCKTTEAGADNILVTKLCTGFGNTNMFRASLFNLGT